MTEVSAICRHCKTTDTIRVDDGDYDRWLNREGLVQNIFPLLSADQRELLLGHRSGWYVCHECWDDVMGEDDDEDEEEDDPLTWDKPEPPWKDEPSTDRRVRDAE